MLRAGRRIASNSLLLSLGLLRSQRRHQSTDNSTLPPTGEEQQHNGRQQPTRNAHYQSNQQNGGGRYNDNRRYNNNGNGGRQNNNAFNNRHHSNGGRHQQQHNPQTTMEPLNIKPEDLPDNMSALEAELTKRYGPLSQLQTRFDRRGQRFKAQATFRQCGFAVELATGVGPTAVDAARVVVSQALALDIMFIDPRIRVATASNLIARTKATFDELRSLCTNAGRMIKFSVVPASQASTIDHSAEASTGDASSPAEEAADASSGGEAASTADGSEVVSCREAASTADSSAKKKVTTGWAVRSFIRDDWAAISQLLPLVEIVDDSANNALNANAFQILETYRAEFASQEVVKEEFNELKRHLKAFEEKELSDVCTEDQGTRTYTVSVQVNDKNGNTYQVQSKGNRQAINAYNNVANAIFKIEMDQGPLHRPLLSQLRWQVDAMCLALYGSTAFYREERMSNALHGQLVVDEPFDTPRRVKPSNESSPNSSLQADVSTSSDSASPHAQQEEGFSLFAGRVLAEGTGQGSYRIEFNCYVTALRKLLVDHADVAAQNKSLPFLREIDLDAAVAKHDSFDVVNVHKGKWNSFACLGTITSALIGSFYQSEFEEVPEGLHISTRSHILINDGERFSRLLTSRLAKDKSDAWRTACCDAIRDNFPSQHEQLLKVDEYAQSISKTEGMVSKHRSLPREQRAPHFSTLFSMLQSFAQEDFMWTQMQLIAVEGKGQQWMGEVHALEAGVSKCIYQSDCFASAKMAKKVACYAVANKHYPKETQVYVGLNRGDYTASDRDFLDKIISRTYDSRKPLTEQITALIEKNQPQLKPISWRLEAMDQTGRQRATVLSKGDAPIADVAGEPLESAVSTLQRALLAACKATNTPAQKLLEEYMLTSPANVNSERDLASYLFVSFMGKLPQVHSVYVKPNWVQTLSIEIDDGHRILLHRSEHEQKKEGMLHAYIMAAKVSFPQLLKNIAATPCDMREIAKKILERKGSQIMLDGRVEVIDGVSGGKGDAESDSRAAAAPPAGSTKPISKAVAFLDKCVAADVGFVMTTKIEVMSNGQTKVTLSRSDAARRQSEVAGTGIGSTPDEAVHHASVAVLENLFDTHMANEMELVPDLCDFPPSSESASADGEVQ